MIAEVIIEALWLVTAYGTGCDTKPNHPTKAGTMPVVAFTIAADPAVLPIGSIVEIEGLGERMVHDIGPKVKGRHIDVFMSDCREAKHVRVWRRVKIKHIGGSNSGLKSLTFRHRYDTIKANLKGANK